MISPPSWPEKGPGGWSKGFSSTLLEDGTAPEGNVVLSRPGGQVTARRRLRISRVAGFALVAVGLLLLSAVGAYYGYGVYARSQLDRLNVSVPQPRPVQADSVGLNTVSGAARSTPTDANGSDHPIARPANGHGGAPGSALGTASNGADLEELPEPATASVGDALLSKYGGLYPGLQIHPKYWHQPTWAGSATRQILGLPEGFVPVSASIGMIGSGRSTPATQILVPMIGIDSTVGELAIVDLGDSRAYETPNNTVGHIPSTSDPGDLGSGWFFGHLESPILGEGNVFQKLPKIPDLLRNYIETGEDPVYVILVNDDGQYLYEVTETRVVHQDDLALYDSESSEIVLVACVPRLVYDYRILVTAKLVGFRA